MIQHDETIHKQFFGDGPGHSNGSNIRGRMDNNNIAIRKDDEYLYLYLPSFILANE